MVSACASVLATTNSTPRKPAVIIFVDGHCRRHLPTPKHGDARLQAR